MDQRRHDAWWRVVRLVWLPLLVALWAGGVRAQSVEGQEVEGEITENTIWSAAQGPYRVISTVSIQDGAVLTIEPGTVVHMGADTDLRVESGALRAVGTSSSRIRITSYRDLSSGSPQKGDWGSLWFLENDPSRQSRLWHVEIAYGRGVRLENAAPAMDSVHIHHHSGAALRMDHASSPKGWNNQATENDLNSIEVEAGVITGEVTWGLRGIPYVVRGDLSVGAPPRLNRMNPSSLVSGVTQRIRLSGSRLEGLQDLRFVRSGVVLPGFTAEVRPGGNAEVVEVDVTAPAGLSSGSVQWSGLVDAGELPLGTLTVGQPSLEWQSRGSLWIGRGRSVAVALRLSHPAPEGGLEVSLESTDTAVVPAPDSVRVPAGERVASFEITGSSVGQASLTASAPGYQFRGGSRSIRVLELTLSLTNYRSTIAVGRVETVRLELSVAAPAGGLEVNLVSSNTAVMMVPEGVTVPADSREVTFQLTGVAAGRSTLTMTATGYSSRDNNFRVRVPYFTLLRAPLRTWRIGSGWSYQESLQLSDPAPSDGLEVSLENSDASVVTVPSSVTVPAGRSRVTFQIEGVTAGSAMLTISADGYSTARCRYDRKM